MRRHTDYPLTNQWFGICRGCKKQILWTRTKTGKAMPLNPEAIRFTPAGGPETFVTADGNVIRGKRDGSGAVIGYISHFATCPEHDRFRR